MNKSRVRPCNGSEAIGIYSQVKSSKTMKELFVKYFGRILAILGCSTLVTACYGVPAQPFEVKGRVVDAETGMPIQNIKVTAAAGNGIGSTTGVGSVATPEDSYAGSEYTERNGEFTIILHEYYYPDGFIVECTDVDGAENGSYESAKEAVPMENSQDFVMKMTPKD